MIDASGALFLRRLADRTGGAGHRAGSRRSNYQ
jgi:hypothetical protein